VPASTDRVMLLLLGALTLLPVHAAEPRWPTQQEIDAARIKRPMRSLEEIMRQSVPQVPNIAPQRPAIDVEAIARRYGENRQAFEGAIGGEPTLRIFVTLAMPEASLKLLAAQAAKAQATVVIRGLKDDSMRATLAAVQGIIGESQVAWQIDPQAFTRFRIERAPAFVLVAQGATASTDNSDCKTNCERPEAFVSVAGDVSLDYALGFIARTKPAFADDAQRYLKRLAGAGAIR
jgi:conjugal transfer pilus assembly protein TrbC